MWQGLSGLEALQQHWLMAFSLKESSVSKTDFKLDMVAHTRSSSTWGAKAELSWLQSLPGLQSKKQFQISNKQKKSIPVKFSALSSKCRESQIAKCRPLECPPQCFMFAALRLEAWLPEFYSSSSYIPAFPCFYLKTRSHEVWLWTHGLLCHYYGDKFRSLTNATALIRMLLSWLLGHDLDHYGVGCCKYDHHATVMISFNHGHDCMPLSWSWCCYHNQHTWFGSLCRR